MADWFKFYENFFDEPRFQYAVHQLPEVCAVTVLLLCEHCRHKSATISWTGDDIDLLGFSAKANVSPGKINEAVNLLQKIKYVSVSGGKLTFLKWNDLQSNYVKRMIKKKGKDVRTVAEQCANTSRTVCGPEERRGEEIRSEKPEGVWKLEDAYRWQETSNKQGSDYTREEVHSAFNAFEANGWMFGRNPVVDPRAAIERQIQTDRERKKPNAINQSNRPISGQDRNAGTYNEGVGPKYRNAAAKSQERAAKLRDVQRPNLAENGSGCSGL